MVLKVGCCTLIQHSSDHQVESIMVLMTT